MLEGSKRILLIVEALIPVIALIDFMFRIAL
jgi:hypothetical protein